MKNFAKLRRISAKLILPAIAALGFTACDEVSEYDRYIELPEIQNTAKTVLLEDFTGQNCVNCPAAHEVMELLSEQYGDRLICVSVHAGELAIPVERTRFEAGYIGLRTAEGDAYNNAAGVGHWPMGSVDFGSAIDPDQWGSAVRQQLELDPAAHIELSATVADGKVKISSELTPLTDFKGKYLVWIVESDIVTVQRGESGLKLDYVHNNVFRAAVNGTWGQDLELKDGIKATVDNEIELRDNQYEKWNADNLAVVAFIYDDRGVQQAAMVDVE